MTAPAAAADLRAHLGERRFRRFASSVRRTVPRQPAPLLWQEGVWAEFLDAFPRHRGLSLGAVLGEPGVCLVHMTERLPDAVPALYGHWHFPADYLDALEDRFPNAVMTYHGDSVELERPPVRGVYYCPECRRALIEWNEGRTHPIGLPG